MAITVEAYTGTGTIGSTERSMTSGGSPDVIQTQTDAGIFQAFVDLNAMAANDVFEFACYEKTRTGDTQRKVFTADFANAQASPIWASPCLVLGLGWDMTIKKMSGTDRTIAWRISRIA